MATAGEDVVIAFNGEIYGFELMRRALEARGVVFRGRSDTEVLLQLYLHLGPGFVRELEGEFAFVLIDRRNGCAMLARDRFGIKPLLYALTSERFVFASEQRALVRSGLIDVSLDIDVARRLMGSYDCGPRLPQYRLDGSPERRSRMGCWSKKLGADCACAGRGER